MAKFTKDQQEAMLSDFAYAAQRYLNETNSIRRALNEEPHWEKAEEICNEIGLSRTLWPSVNDRMLELGIQICLWPFGGYYLGLPGEAASQVRHKAAMMTGIGNAINRQLMALAKSHTLEEASEFSRTVYGYSLTDLPKMLDAINAPLPKEIETLLLSPSLLLV